MLDNFQYQSQFVDTENITCRDQRKNVQITAKILLYTMSVLWNTDYVMNNTMGEEYSTSRSIELVIIIDK